MDDSATGEVTQLLEAYRSGDRSSLERLMPILYEDFKGIARQQRRRATPGHTLNTTALANEAYLKLQGGNRRQMPATENEFKGLAACVMRGIIVDTVRAKVAHKRGHGVTPEEINEEIVGDPRISDRVLEVDEALRKLESIDEDLVRLVEYKYFAGYSGDEIGAITGQSRRTVQRDWQRAKALLGQIMEAE